MMAMRLGTYKEAHETTDPTPQNKVCAAITSNKSNSHRTNDKNFCRLWDWNQKSQQTNLLQFPQLPTHPS